MRKKRRLGVNLLLSALTFLVLVVFAFPFLWMLLASFKTQAQIMSSDHFFCIHGER